jgi:hypothetical protein
MTTIKPIRFQPLSIQARHQKQGQSQNVMPGQVSPAFGLTATPEQKQRRTPLTTAIMAMMATVYPSFMTPGAMAQPASGKENKILRSPQLTENSRNIVDWVKRAWEGKDYKDKNWNDIRVGLRVSDNTKLMEIHPYRVEILRRGASNPDIPAQVVHEAIYTAGILGANISDEAVKRELAELLMPYTERMIVDYRDDKGEKVRAFVPSFTIGRPNAQGYDFRNAASNAVAKVADSQTISNIVQSLLMAGSSPQRVKPLFSILQNTPNHVPLPEIQSKALDWIYASESKKDKDETEVLLRQLLERLKDKEQAASDRAAIGTEEKNKFEGLPEELTKPELRKFANAEERRLAAEAIRFLTKRGEKTTLPAIARPVSVQFRRRPDCAGVLGNSCLERQNSL